MNYSTIRPNDIPTHRDLGFDVISEAYQHEAPAKADLTMRRGGHTPEDTFELPTLTPYVSLDKDALKRARIDAAHKLVDGPPYIIKDTPEYSAGYTGSGKVILVLSTPDRTIGYFDTFADAQLAAEALNNHKGY
jgi:hypothetical protein